MKRFIPVIVLVALVFAVVPAQAAGVLSDHICYWVRMGDGSVETVINPDTADWTWLRQNWSSVLLRVQQTVYDSESTSVLLAKSDYTAPEDSCLFSYSVSNIGWFDSIDNGGMKSFAVEWDFMPVMVLTSAWQTPAGWTASSSETGPVWTWTPPVGEQDAPGLLPGSSVGGFWALASTGETCVVDCCASTSEGNGEIVILGKTIAPVPEPAGVFALAVGLVGLIMRRRIK